MDKHELLRILFAEYRETQPKSEKHHQKAKKYLVGGGSHNLRLFEPFPFYDVHCEGSKVTDMDGRVYVDFWQGHFANILGHNPPVVLEVLRKKFCTAQGLATGFPGVFQSELAELVLERSYAEKIRFTTSGTLATMYAIMLAKSYTSRELVMKIGGGWHGAQPYVLKGISTYDQGLHQIESAGLPVQADAMILTTEFNDIADLEAKFRQHGERVACLIIEPFIGAGGFMFGSKDYLHKIRDLTRAYGALLIFDEVVSGFRFHAGSLQLLYGIQPDLSVFGKAIGGGMPVSAVAGREDVMALCGRDAPLEKRVKFEGGTFCAHPASILAGLAFLKHLIDNESEIYPRMASLGEKMRTEIPAIFARYGFNVRCTGEAEGIQAGSSVVGVHFLLDHADRIVSPEQVWNPAVCDFDLREKIFKLAMLAEGFNIFHGLGAISSAHTKGEIQSCLDAIERIAKRWKALGLEIRTS